MTFDVVKLNAEDYKLDIYTLSKYQINSSVETCKYKMTVMSIGGKNIFFLATFDKSEKLSAKCCNIRR